MFKPRGVLPQWRYIYDHMQRMSVGDIITYDQAAKLLPGVPEQSLRGAINQAIRKMEELDKRTFEAVRGVGYRMVAAKEHERLALTKQKEGRRKLGKALRKVDSADFAQLDATQRRRLAELRGHLARQADLLKRLDKRTLDTLALAEATEQRVSEAEKEQLRTDDRLARLEAQLKQLRGEDGGEGNVY